MNIATEKVITGFDVNFPKGIFTESSKNVPLYDFKRMKEYCAKKGISTSKLSEKEMAQFELIEK